MITTSITRRTLLTACGTDGTDGGREVKTDKGPITVPPAAKRVACADFFGAFRVVDLGLVPVAASGSGDDTGRTYAPKLAKVPLVADTEPDLILRTIDTDDALYEQLTGIAPTVVISFHRPAQAAALLARYEGRCTEMRSTHADALERYTFTFAQVASDATFWTLGEKWTDTKVLVDCGVRLAEPSASQAEATEEYSLECVTVLDQSDVLLIPSGPDGVTEAPDNQPLTGSALWQQLPAVRAGRVWPIVSGAASLGTALELITRLDTVLTELAAT